MLRVMRAAAVVAGLGLSVVRAQEGAVAVLPNDDMPVMTIEEVDATLDSQALSLGLQGSADESAVTHPDSLNGEVASGCSATPA